MPASPPSTRPTSTPWGRRNRCSGAPSRGVRRESIEIFTKVYWPTGPNPNDRGLYAQAHHRVAATARSNGWGPTTWTCSRRTATTTRRRSKRRCGPSTTWSARARSTTSGSRSGRPTDRGRVATGRRNGLRPHHLQPAAVLLFGGSLRPRSSRCARRRAWARSCGPPGPGRPDRQVPPGPVRAAGRLAGQRPRGRRNELAAPRRGARAGAGLRRAVPGGRSTRRLRSPWPGCCATRT